MTDPQAAATLTGRTEPAVVKHDVTIFEAGGYIKVRPPSVTLPTDDTLHIVNLTAEDVTIMFPAVVFEPYVGPIGPGSDVAVTARTRVPGVYDYAVLAQSRGKSRLGEGESGPRIIID